MTFLINVFSLTRVLALRKSGNGNLARRFKRIPQNQPALSNSATPSFENSPVVGDNACPKRSSRQSHEQRFFGVTHRHSRRVFRVDVRSSIPRSVMLSSQRIGKNKPDIRPSRNGCRLGKRRTASVQAIKCSEIRIPLGISGPFVSKPAAVAQFLLP